MKKLILGIVFSIFIFGSSSAYALSQDSQDKVDSYLSTRYWMYGYNNSVYTFDFEKTSNLVRQAGASSCYISGVSHSFPDGVPCDQIETYYRYFLTARKNLKIAAITDIELRDALNVIFR